MQAQGRYGSSGFQRLIGRLPRLMPGLALLLTLAAPVSDAGAAGADRLQRLLDRFLAEEELDGGILLVSGPEGRRVVVSGIADRRGKRPVTEDTRFYVASVGKMATAAAVLQQVEEGALSLDRPVRDLAPDLSLGKIANADRARLVHLLDHCSGIPDYITDAYQEEEAANPERLPRNGALLAYAAGEKATGPVGGHYAYSNSNYVLLGHIASLRDGIPFAQVLRSRVLERAGMASTSVGADPRDRSLAHGYTEDGDVSRRSWAATTGDGPLVTTAGDLERFVFALFRDDRLLKAATVRRMLTPSENEEGQGLGVALWKDRWGRGVGHDGRYDGFEADVRYYPGRRTALVFLTNGNQQSDDALLDAVAEEVFAP